MPWLSSWPGTDAGHATRSVHRWRGHLDSFCSALLRRCGGQFAPAMGAGRRSCCRQLGGGNQYPRTRSSAALIHSTVPFPFSVTNGQVAMPALLRPLPEAKRDRLGQRRSALDPDLRRSVWRLRRSSSSLPALKCGTTLPGTATSSPVRGLRPTRSPRRGWRIRRSRAARHDRRGPGPSRSARTPCPRSARGHARKDAGSRRRAA